MKTKQLLLFLLFGPAFVFGQGRTYIYDTFTAKIENSELHVYDKNKNEVLDKKFSDPYDLSADLDGDGTEEYIVIDDSKQDNRDFYTLYIFSTADSFYIADSIVSGFMEPYNTHSDEAGGIIIVAGNPNFDSMNVQNMEAYLPVNCWQYGNGKAALVNNKIYKLFVAENDTMMDALDSYYDSNGSECKSTANMKGLIAAVYVNYMHAGDKLLATQFLRRYYHCDDMDDFKKKLNGLL